MHFLKYVVPSVVLLGLADSKPVCGIQRYYDPVVQHCSPCTDICLNAKMQGTVKDCRLKCPDFQLPGSQGKSSGESSGTGNSNLAAIITPSVASVLVVLIIIGFGYMKRQELRQLVNRMYRLTCPERDIINENEGTDGEETTVKQPFLPGDEKQSANQNNEHQDDGENRGNAMEMRIGGASLELVPASDDRRGSSK